MSKIYLIGDTHYGHTRINEKFRQQFSSEEDHNETIHQNIMACAGKTNHLWLLGDVVLSEKHFYKLCQYTLYFDTVNITLGNHDHKELAPYCVQHGIKVHGIVKKWGFWVSHAPIHPQELYRGLCIHGHTHENNVPDDHYFSVSCENVGYKPIKLQDIKDVFRSRGVLE